MKLFAKGKGAPGAPDAAQPGMFRPIDRNGLLSLLEQVTAGGQTGVLELREARGGFVYGFQAGALSHASGGRVRGARQAFDLLWEFQGGEFLYRPGPAPQLASNLYIDKARLIEMLQRSRAAMQGPSSPYIPPGQPPMMPPAGWPQPPQAGRPPAPAVPGWPQPAAWPGQPGYGPAPPPGYGNPQQPAFPQGYPAGAMPPAPVPGQLPPSYGAPQQPPASFPGAAPGMMPGFQGQPGYGAPAAMPPAMAQPATPPAFRPTPAGQPGAPVPPLPSPSMPPAKMPPAQQRPAPSFSVPPMAVPKRRGQTPLYQPPAAAPLPPPVPETPKPAAPQDDLRALRASLVGQAPAGTPSSAPAWNVRAPEGKVVPLPAAAPAAKGKATKQPKPAKAQKPRKPGLLKIQTIKFLLWACERKYSPDDHWTLKDAFEVSTMELRDQFLSAFSQSFAKPSRPTLDDELDDDVASGRMRGRARPRKR